MGDDMNTRLVLFPDGGNPQKSESVWEIGLGHFGVKPYSEDGDINYKFALSIAVQNQGGEPEPVTFDFDWGDTEEMGARHFVHIGGGDDWQYLPVQCQGSVATITFLAPPGLTEVGLSPAYSLGRHTRFVSTLASKGYHALVAGKSEDGREISVYTLGDGPRRVLVTARFHPYETASSFCVEGMLNWLGSRDAESRRLLQEHRFTFVPMPNPDGVYRGLPKRTGEQGVDLSNDGALGGDSTARTLLSIIDNVRPHAFLDVHGWMHADEDGQHCLKREVASAFAAAVSAEEVFRGDKWRLDLSPADNRSAIRPYAQRTYGTEVLAVSYRWPSRTVAQMRGVGVSTLRAFCAAMAQLD